MEEITIRVERCAESGWLVATWDAPEGGGITTQGLEYPLNNERLSFGSPRGVSNVFLHASVHIQLTEGVLLCLVNRSGD